MNLLSEVWFNGHGFQRTQAGVLGYAFVNVGEPLLDENSSVSTIHTISRGAINKRVVCTDKVRADEQFLRGLPAMYREENGEAHLKFVLPERNTGGPFPKA